MMTWETFPGWAMSALVLWTLAVAVSALRGRFAARSSMALAVAGQLAMIVFTFGLWVSLERPPLRTLGETRLWYAVMLPACGLAVEWRWGMRWLRNYCLALAAVFVLVNLAHPEAHDKTLMPALQSVWFVPHVIVYLVAYALLGASSLAAVRGIWLEDHGRKNTQDILQVAERLVTLGFVFLTMGLVFGAVWAKEAWGHYWTWDPKETWAFLTWAVYLAYIHLAIHRPMTRRSAYFLIAGGFVVLLTCWFGLNYMSAGISSVHSYAG
jgi:ABC-type transport system involved in cytochrome c biogenesis permease subunit